jgi:hypothetical protein
MKLFRILFLSIVLIESFSMIGCKKFDANRITKVTTNDLVFANNKVKAIGSIIDISEKGIQDHGFCWAYNPTPTVKDGKFSLNSTSSLGDFNYSFPNLVLGVTYYARAFALSGDQIIYGEVMSFNTEQANVSIEIGSPKIINSGKVTIEGSIDSLGSIVVPQYGHCYSTSPDPTISDSRTINNNLNKDSVFTSEILGLNLNTTYYIRAYAKLSESKIIYSNSETVKIPILKVSTDTFTTVNSTTANLKGTIQELGADPITEYGFVWSITNPNPNYGDNKLINPASPKIGAYFNNLAGLISGNKYYFRAFATNGSSVVYGTIKFIQK